MHRKQSPYFKVVYLLLILLLTNCISPPYRLVEHQVVQGDTLHQIAEQYNVSISSIVRLNKLPANKPIAVGQVLYIRQPSDAPIQQNVGNSDFVGPIASKTQQPLQVAAEQPDNAANTTALPPIANTIAATTTTTVSTDNSPTTEVDELFYAMRHIRSQNKPKVPNWQWFVSPKSAIKTVRQVITDDVIKQLQIDIQLQGYVLASQGGTVTYVGNGLAEYGNLIVIDHGNNMITAYGNVSVPLIASGQSVQTNQKIAIVNPETTLIFEMRRFGKTIDDLPFFDVYIQQFSGQRP